MLAGEYMYASICFHVPCLSTKMYNVYFKHPACTLLTVLACTQLNTKCVRACKAWAHTRAIANHIPSCIPHAHCYQDMHSSCLSSWHTIASCHVMPCCA